MPTSPVNAAALAHARAVQRGTPEEAAATAAELAAVKIEAAIQRALAAAPPLTEAQVAKCVRLLQKDGE